VILSGRFDQFWKVLPFIARKKTIAICCAMSGINFGEVKEEPYSVTCSDYCCSVHPWYRLFWYSFYRDRSTSWKGKEENETSVVSFQRDVISPFGPLACRNLSYLFWVLCLVCFEFQIASAGILSLFGPMACRSLFCLFWVIC
jgi:hypothetical protein